MPLLLTLSRSAPEPLHPIAPLVRAPNRETLTPSTVYLYEERSLVPGSAGIYSTVVIFAVALPIWAFCSSRAASLLLIPMALGGVIWVWIQWSDLKAEIANLHGTELPAPIDAGKTSDDNDV
mmetsp:Transcript_47916/g.74832  ORF Transcript_47916/g.74832 Transcript_47916/m.74832 type:complete len:122 (+) Transcript_47916:911-1276(+)